MASSLAPTPSLNACPATLESVTSFRVKTAALSRPAGPINAPSADVVLITRADGSVVVYPPSEKLKILATKRAAMKDTPVFDLSA